MREERVSIRKRIMGGFFAALFLMMFFGETICAEEETNLDLYATAAVLLDADSGRVLYSRAGDVPMAMASTTKIMTCILVLEEGNLDDVAEVSAYAASMPKVKLNVRKGEQYKVRSLLFSLMLESHNDSAVVLAEYIGQRYLSEELQAKSVAEFTVEESKKAVKAFAARMNEKAVELGCEATWFITPNGLDATETFVTESGESVQREHCTTAAELARIMAYCVKGSPQRELFREITRTGTYSFTENGRTASCSNHNAFLSMMDGAFSGKTGFTNKAGYCYVGALERDGRTFIVALLACGWPNNKTYKWSDTRKLMSYGIEHYFYREIQSEGDAKEQWLSPIVVENGQSRILGGEAKVHLEVEPMEQETAYALGYRDGLLMRADEEVCVECDVQRILQAPVQAGEVVGEIRYLVDGKVYRRERIVTKEGVALIDFGWCMEQIGKRFLVR